MIETIRKMEERYNEVFPVLEQLDAALDAYEAALPLLKELLDWYSSPDWMKAYEADERGELPSPAELPRGVLTEDCLYDLLSEHVRLQQRMKSLAKENDDAIPQG